MKSLAPFGISAWSWIGALGAESFSSTKDEAKPARLASLTLAKILERPTLSSHEQSLGIPGYSARCELGLAPLPSALSQHESRCARLLVQCLQPILASVKSACLRYGKEQVALVLASSTGGVDGTEKAFAERDERGELPQHYDFDQVHPHHALLQVVKTLCGLEGPTYLISTACSSSGKAIAAAQRLLDSGRAKAVLSGGADSLCELTQRGFAGLGVLSKEPSRPFDGKRSGINIGEGAALLLLEAESATPYYLLGSGESSDAYHCASPDPEGKGAQLCLAACLRSTGQKREDIAYVNAHGTGTQQNDQMEALAIHEVLGSKVPFSSTKHKTGHLLGAAGAMEAIFCLQALREGRLPANLQALQVDSTLAVQPQQETIQLQNTSPIALSNSFAFGGSNVSLAVAVGPREPGVPTQHKVRAPASYSVKQIALWTPYHERANNWLTHKRDGLEVEGAPPRAQLLPARARGRASLLTRIFAELYEQLLPLGETRDLFASEIPTVYASAYGELATTGMLLERLPHDTTLSPLKFPASVHNTAAGKISIATGNRSFTTSLAAGTESFSMALLEAQAWLDCHGGDIFVMVADEELPDLFGSKCKPTAMGVGLHLSLRTSSSIGSDLGLLGPVEKSARQQYTDYLPRNANTEKLKGLGQSASSWALPLLDGLLSASRRLPAIGPGYRIQLSPIADPHP